MRKVEMKRALHNKEMNEAEKIQVKIKQYHTLLSPSLGGLQEVQLREAVLLVYKDDFRLQFRIFCLCHGGLWLIKISASKLCRFGFLTMMGAETPSLEGLQKVHLREVVLLVYKDEFRPQFRIVCLCHGGLWIIKISASKLGRFGCLTMMGAETRNQSIIITRKVSIGFDSDMFPPGRGQTHAKIC